MSDKQLISGLNTGRSAKLFDAACKLIPGGVNSTARATWSGWNPYPLFVKDGKGSHLTDVDVDLVFADHLPPRKVALMKEHAHG